MFDFSNMDWEDLRHFLAVARAGTATGAARALKASPSTVIKRVGDLEAALGQPLFDRSREGCSLTEFGRAVLARAEPFEAAADDVARLAEGAPSPLSGVVRIATTEVLATFWVAPRLPELRALHPELRIELLAGSRVVSLARREADLALRLARPEAGDLAARRIADVTFRGYAARRRPAGDPPGWIAFEEAPAVTVLGAAVEARLEGRPPVLRAGSFAIHWQAARAGVGAALLPAFLGDSDPVLEPLPDAEEPLRLGLWLVVHRDLRGSPRVRAAMEFLTAAAGADRRRLAGETASP